MADLKNKYPDNISGVYYVDKKCIGCRACVGIAPDFFKMNYDAKHAFVKRQPVSSENASKCNAALKRCPVQAIGNDGYLDIKIVKDLGFKISHLTNNFNPLKPFNTDVKISNYRQSIFDIKIDLNNDRY